MKILYPIDLRGLRALVEIVLFLPRHSKLDSAGVVVVIVSLFRQKQYFLFLFAGK